MPDALAGVRYAHCPCGWDLMLKQVEFGPSLLRDWIDRAAERDPDKAYIACIDDRRSISYRHLQRLTRRIAAFLAERGLGTNDRVALLAGNSIEHLVTYIGVMAYGATICTVHVEMNRSHLAQILPALNPQFIVFDAGLELGDVLAKTSAPCLPLGSFDGNADVGFFKSVIDCEPTDIKLAGTRPQDDACILFTSGTSARPKGVVLTFRELLSNVAPTADGLGMTADDRIYDFRSFNWCSAQVLSALAPLSRGASLILGRKFTRSRYFQNIADYGATITAGNPTTINMLLNGEGPADAKALSSLRFIISSSAPLLSEDWRRFEQRFGVPVAQSYGCSEIGWIATNPGAGRHIDTVGKPAPYLKLAIVNDRGQTLAVGETGHVEVGAFADNDFRYLADDGAIRVHSRGRLRTGDIGFLDADGYLHITGREKDLIIRGGINISPLEIDSILLQRPEVIEVATVGVPDHTYGEEVVSFVVARPGANIDADDLLRYCGAVLPASKAPKQIVLSDQLPKTARGKLDRRALAKQWTSSHRRLPT
jgi:acyl-coenzyme A synthetase/AMP-(fatty) acid ligase